MAATELPTAALDMANDIESGHSVRICCKPPQPSQYGLFRYSHWNSPVASSTSCKPYTMPSGSEVLGVQEKLPLFGVVSTIG